MKLILVILDPNNLKINHFIIMLFKKKIMLILKDTKVLMKLIISLKKKIKVL
jgi:hypothetical protein